ncbi:hypothetical protein [Streptomyces sp. bgisy100]|uniref:hypothetical protein n=1 Tax=Streptomyces sp. bgisy100 TaxID=3413783 RepID=UPI003D728A75
MDWRGWSELLVVVALVARMITAGYFRHPGKIFSWPMFSNGCSIVIELHGTRDGEREPINIFDLFPTGDTLGLTTTDLQSVCDYLMTTYDSVDGEGRMMFAEGNVPLKVVNGHVVV